MNRKYTIQYILITFLTVLDFSISYAEKKDINRNSEERNLLETPTYVDKNNLKLDNKSLDNKTNLPLSFPKTFHDRGIVFDGRTILGFSGSGLDLNCGVFSQHSYRNNYFSCNSLYYDVTSTFDFLYNYSKWLCKNRNKLYSYNLTQHNIIVSTMVDFGILGLYLNKDTFINFGFDISANLFFNIVSYCKSDLYKYKKKSLFGGGLLVGYSLNLWLKKIKLKIGAGVGREFSSKLKGLKYVGPSKDEGFSGLGIGGGVFAAFVILRVFVKIL